MNTPVSSLRRLRSEPAGLRPRLMAGLIDAVLLALLSMPLMWLAYGQVIARLDDLRPASLAINWLLPLLLVVGCWRRFGATPGKALLGLRVVDASSGARPGVLQGLLRWVGGIVAALPLGLGLLWIGWDRQNQGWHDKLAHTLVLRQVPLRPAGPVAPGYLAAHWRGELPLSVSFWINNLLLSLPAGFALGLLMSWISLKGEALRASSVAMLVGWPLLVAVDTWCIVGAWRSASRHPERGGSALWARAAQGVLALSALGTLSSTLLDFVPQAGDYLKLARGIDPLGRLEVGLSADGRRLRLSGPVGMGDAERVRELLARAPAVRMVEIQSPGGRVHEADQIAEVVRQRAWDTRASGDCASACTLVFLAGAQRQLMPGARLGFHRAYAGTFNPVIDELANQEVASMYRRAGLPEDFIARVLLVPPWGIWYPNLEELAAGGLVPLPGRTLDIPLSTVASGEPEDTIEVLRTHPAWHALERRFPGTLKAAAQRMHDARAQGGSDERVLLEGQRVVQGLLPALLKGTSPEAAERFARMLAAQLRVAQAAGGASCRALLLGDAAARRRLPAELLQREADWLADAATQSAGDRARHPPSALELEVMRRSLGERSPGLLRSLWGPAGQGEPTRDCAAALELLDAMASLPPAERRLAARLAFQQV